MALMMKKLTWMKIQLWLLFVKDVVQQDRNRQPERHQDIRHKQKPVFVVAKTIGVAPVHYAH